MLKKTLALLMFFSLSACLDPNEENGGTDLFELQLAQQKWHRSLQSHPNFSFVQTQSTFWSHIEAHVTIENGDYTECFFVTVTDLEPEPSETGCGDGIPSVEAHFQIVESAIREGAHSINVKYHPDLGYPTSIRIDHVLIMADEETHMSLDVTLL